MQILTPDGKAYALNPGLNTVGRIRGNDIVLEDGSMSRQHAELHWDGQICTVIDLGSTNGTFVNGQRLVPGQPQVVLPGARLSFGPTMDVTLRGDPAHAAHGWPPAAPQSPLKNLASSAVPGTGLDMIFRALDIALDYRKLGVAFAAFLMMGVVGAGFLWISAQISAESAVLGTVVGLVGLVLVLLILTLTVAVLSRLSLVELREGRKETVREALRYAVEHFLAFLFSPLLLVLGLVLLLVVEAILLLVGRVDYVGELLVSLVFLPLALLNLGLLIVAWFGSALTFPVVADRGAGIRDTLSHVLAIVRRAPGQLVAYMMVVGFASLVMLVVSIYLFSLSFYTTMAFTAVGMEPAKFMVVLSGLPLDVGGLIPGLSYGSLGRYLLGEPPVTHAIARFVFGLSFGALAMLALSIPLLFSLAGACAVYLGLAPAVPDIGPADDRRVGRMQSRQYAAASKACSYCGAALAYDQTYCPHCGNVQP